MRPLRTALLTLIALVLLASPAAAVNTTTTTEEVPPPVCVQKITAHTLSGGTATFTVGDNCEVQVSLASYKLPGSTFDPSTVGSQVLYDSASGTFGPGPHTLSVRLPRCYWQVDLVHGPVLRIPTYAGKIIATRIGGQGDCFPPDTPTTTVPEIPTTTVPPTMTVPPPPITDTPPPADVSPPPPAPPAPAPPAPAPAPVAPTARIATVPASSAPLTQLPHTGSNWLLALAGVSCLVAGAWFVVLARRAERVGRV